MCVCVLSPPVFIRLNLHLCEKGSERKGFGGRAGGAGGELPNNFTAALSIPSETVIIF